MSDDERDDVAADMLAHQERVDAFMAKLPRPEGTQAPRSPSEVLADIVVAAAFPAALLEDIRAGRPCCIVVKVPTAAWVEPISDAITALAEDDSRLLVISRTQAQKDRNLPSLGSRLAAGERVIGVSQFPDASLPPLMLTMAEHRIEIPRFTPELIAGALKSIQHGPVPARALKIDCELVDFDEFAALLQPGATPARIIARLKALIQPKLRVGTRRDKLPLLEEAVEYGEARDWGLALRDDLRDLRAKKIDAKDVDRGMLLYGPPGTGKTLYGRLLGEACGIPTVSSSLGELFASGTGYLDSMIKAQRSLFEEARSKAPCVLAIDEIDALPHPGTVSRRNRDYWMPLITDFYTLLDGALSDRAGVIVIGTTNRRESIDPALLRPSRLERAIYLGPPAAAGAERILRHHLETDLECDDLTRVAAIAAARRCTGAMIEEHVRAARRVARRAGRPMILDDLVARIAPLEMRSEADLRRVAAHEAGHALAVTLLKIGKITDVSLVADDEQQGAIEFTGDGQLITKARAYDLARALLAGRAGEMVMMGEPSSGAGGGIDSDLAQATNLVGSLFLTSGMEDQLVYRGGPDKLFDIMSIDVMLRNKVDGLLRTLLNDVVDLLGRNRDQLELLAGNLLERRFLTGDEVLERLAANRVSK